MTEGEFMTNKSLVHQDHLLALAAIRIRGDAAEVAAASTGAATSDIREDQHLRDWLQQHAARTTFIADAPSRLLTELDTQSNLQACDAVLAVLYAARDTWGVDPARLLEAAAARGPQAIQAGPTGL